MKVVNIQKMEFPDQEFIKDLNEPEDKSEKNEEKEKPKPFTTRTLYELLDEKECFTKDQDEDRKVLCVYTVLEEKTKYGDLDYKEYQHTADYAVNKAIHEVYGDVALKELSPAYRNYLALNNLPLQPEKEDNIQKQKAYR